MQIGAYNGVVDDVLRSALKSIKIETSYTPPIVLDDPFKPSPPGSTSAARLLKPKITFNTSGGNFTLQPYGTPSNHWPFVKLGLLGVGILAVLGLMRWGEKKRR